MAELLTWYSMQTLLLPSKYGLKILDKDESKLGIFLCEIFAKTELKLANDELMNEVSFKSNLLCGFSQPARSTNANLAELPSKENSIIKCERDEVRFWSVDFFDRSFNTLSIRTLNWSYDSIDVFVAIRLCFIFDFIWPLKSNKSFWMTSITAISKRVLFWRIACTDIPNIPSEFIDSNMVQVLPLPVINEIWNKLTKSFKNSFQSTENFYPLFHGKIHKRFHHSEIFSEMASNCWIYHRNSIHGKYDRNTAILYAFDYLFKEELF